LNTGEVATQSRHLFLELLDPAPQVFHQVVGRGSSSSAVAHHGLQPWQHGAGLEDPLAQALVVGRDRDRDLEAAIDDAPILELPSPAEHVVSAGLLYVGFTSTL